MGGGGVDLFEDVADGTGGEASLGKVGVVAGAGEDGGKRGLLEFFFSSDPDF